MQSRRDQLQAHYFVSGRLVSALLRADPDSPQTPMRRFSMGAFAGAMIAVIIVAGVTIFGFVFPGGKTSYREPGTLIVEKETGARYVLLGGELRPVLNYASARLILGADMTVTSVSKKSLRGVPHGLPVGIEAAPDFLPNPKDLTGTQWRVISAVRADETGTDQPFVSLQIGSPKSRANLDDKSALVVKTDDGTMYLAWKDRRLRIPGGAALAALGYGTAQQFLVGPAFINALPAGPDLEAPTVPNIGQRGPTIAGRATRIGQVFVVSTEESGDQHFVVRSDGLSPLSPTDVALLFSDKKTRLAYPDGPPDEISLSASAFGNAPRSSVSTVTADFPPVPPKAVEPSGTSAPCLNISVSAADDAKVRVAIEADPIIPKAPPATTQSRFAIDQALVDRVDVEPGHGLLVRAQPGPGINTGTLFLLVDAGVRWPLASADVAATLGYSGVVPVAVPTTLLNLIPTGRPLSPDAAKNTVPVVPSDTGVLPQPIDPTVTGDTALDPTGGDTTAGAATGGADAGSADTGGAANLPGAPDLGSDQRGG